jgi:hypothetical protein
MNENETTKYQNLCDTVKAVLRGNFIAMNVFCKNKKDFTVAKLWNQPSFPPKDEWIKQM